MRKIEDDDDDDVDDENDDLLFVVAVSCVVDVDVDVAGRAVVVLAVATRGISGEEDSTPGRNGHGH